MSMEPISGGLAQMSADTLVRAHPLATRIGDMLTVERKTPEFLAREMRGEVPLTESVDLLSGFDLATGPAYATAKGALKAGSLGLETLGKTLLPLALKEAAGEAGIGAAADVAGRGVAELTDSPMLSLAASALAGVSPGMVRTAARFTPKARAARAAGKAAEAAEALRAEDAVATAATARSEREALERVSAEGQESFRLREAQERWDSLSRNEQNIELNREQRERALEPLGSALDPETRSVLDKFPYLEDEARTAAEFNSPNVKPRSHNDVALERLGRKLEPAEQHYLGVRERYENMERALRDPDAMADRATNTTAIYRDAMSQLDAAAKPLTPEARAKIDLVNPREIHSLGTGDRGMDSKRRILTNALGYPPSPSEFTYGSLWGKAWNRVYQSTGEDLFELRHAGDNVRDTPHPRGRDAEGGGVGSDEAYPDPAAGAGGPHVRMHEPRPKGSPPVHVAKQNAEWDQAENVVRMKLPDGEYFYRSPARLVEWDQLGDDVFHVTSGGDSGAIYGTPNYLGDGNSVSVLTSATEARKVKDDLNHTRLLAHTYENIPDKNNLSAKDKLGMKQILERIISDDARTGWLPRSGKNQINPVSILTETQWDWRRVMLEYMDRRAGLDGARQTRMPTIESMDTTKEFHVVRIEKQHIPKDAAIVRVSDLSKNELHIFSDIYMPARHEAGRPEVIATSLHPDKPDAPSAGPMPKGGPDGPQVGPPGSGSATAGQITDLSGRLTHTTAGTPIEPVKVTDEEMAHTDADFKGTDPNKPPDQMRKPFPRETSYWDDADEVGAGAREPGSRPPGRSRRGPVWRPDAEGGVTRVQRATGSHEGTVGSQPGVPPKRPPGSAKNPAMPKTAGWAHPPTPEARAAHEPQKPVTGNGYDPTRVRLDPKAVRGKKNIPDELKKATTKIYDYMTTQTSWHGPEWDAAAQIRRGRLAEMRNLNGFNKSQLMKIIPKVSKMFKETRRSINTIHQLFAEADDAEIFDFITRWEARLPQIDGKVISAESKEAVLTAMHSILEPLRKEFEKLEPSQKRAWFDNYFPRIWDPKKTIENQGRLIREHGPDAIPEEWRLKVNTEDEIQRVYTANKSSKGFATARQSISDDPFDSFSKMTNMGFVPMTRNPVEMILFKAGQITAHMAAVRQLDDMLKKGTVRRMLRSDYAKEQAEAARNGLYYDWHEVGDIIEGIPLMPATYKDLDPMGKQVGVKHVSGKEKYAYIAPASVKQLMTNVSSAGLMQARGGVGEFFRQWRQSNGWLNNIQLGISTFHTSTMSNEGMVSNMAQALQRATGGVLTATGMAKYVDPITGKKVTSMELARQTKHFLGKAAKSPVIFARSLPGIRKLTEGRFVAPGEVEQAEMTRIISRGLEATLKGEVNPERMRNVPVLANLQADEHTLIGMIRRGADAMAQESGGAFDPTIPMMMELAVRSGGDFMHGGMPTDWHRTYHDIWTNARAELQRGQSLTESGGNAMKEAVTKLTQVLSKPLFDTVIPQVKIRAYMDMMQWELMRMGGDYTADSVLKKGVEVKNSIDNRFGEMTYDNLMMHRMAKDVMMLTQRAPGWNLGTVREIGGGFADTARYTAGKARQLGEKVAGKEATKNTSQWTQRMSYNVGLAMHTAMLASAYQWIMTRTLPSDDIQEGEDFMTTMKRYIFPRNGQKKNGYDQRVSMAGYEKDFYAFINHPLQTMGHKLAPMIAVGERLVTGSDYYGNLLYDPAANTVTQWAQQITGAAGEAIMPFSGSAIREQIKTGANPVSGIGQTLVGFNPAPAYVTRSSADNKMTEYMSEFKPSPKQAPLDYKRGEARREIVSFLRSKQDPNEPDRPHPAEAIKTYVTLGGERGAADLRRLATNVDRRDDFQNRLNGFLAEIKNPSRAYALFDVVEQMSPDELKRGWDSIMKRVYTLRERSRSPEELASIDEQWQALLEKARSDWAAIHGG
jgi:hypothetical protein